MNPICFYHSCDLDGCCSAAIVRQRVPDVELYPIDHGDIFPWDKVTSERDVYMVDFSLPIDDMHKLSVSRNLYWIDHHKGPVDDMNKFSCRADGIVLKTGVAACELTWLFFDAGKDSALTLSLADKYITGDSWLVPYGVRLLGRYDVWGDEAKEWDTEILPFQYGMKNIYYQPDNNGLWTSIFSTSGDESDLYEVEFISDILATGSLLLNYQNKQYKEIVDRLAFEIKFRGLRAIACNYGPTGIVNSQLFNSIWDESKYDIMILYYWNPKHQKWTHSLYSTKEEVDCQQLAKMYEGGGHKGAAGFETIDSAMYYNEEII